MKQKAVEFMPIVNAPVVTASATVLRVYVYGEVEVQTFESSDKNSLIAGCKVISGTLARQAVYRIVRESNVYVKEWNEDQVIFKGSTFDSMKHFKDEVDSVMEGKECGVQIQNFTVRIK